MKQLVRLRMRPSRDGKSFAYFLDYKDEDGKRRRISLGHADRRKAKRQQAEKERELRMGIVAPESMRLSEFEVMKLAGHANFSTTHRFYLRVRDDLIDRARQASTRAPNTNLAHIWHAPPLARNCPGGQPPQYPANAEVVNRSR